MGLLDQLWDDTVAGPRPESGLGKLRKFSSFSPSSPSSFSSSSSSSSSPHPPPPAVDVTFTRTITVARSPRGVSADSGSLPPSPAGVPDSPLSSPSSTTPWGDWSRRLRKSKQMAEGMETAEPRSPTVYDWVVISSLDR